MSDFLYHCMVCDKQTVSAKAAEIEDAACCMTCAESHNGPGKFEQYSLIDPEDFRKHCAESMGKALILYTWMLDGGEDESMHQEGWGGLYRFDNYVLQIDDRGFVTFEEYEDQEKLEKDWNDWYNDGWGASEDDFYLQWDRFKGWQIFSSFKEIPVRPSYNQEFVTRNRALAAISLHMRDTGYYPDVWESGERGGVTNISKEVRWLERVKS